MTYEFTDPDSHGDRARRYWESITEYKPDRHPSRAERITDLGHDLSAFFEPHHYGEVNWPWTSRDDD